MRTSISECLCGKNYSCRLKTVFVKTVFVENKQFSSFGKNGLKYKESEQYRFTLDLPSALRLIWLNFTLTSIKSN